MHKRCIRVCFGITVSVRSADLQLLSVFLQSSDILLQCLCVPLLRPLPLPDSVDKVLFRHPVMAQISFQQLFQIVRVVFRVCRQFQSIVLQFSVQSFQQLRYFSKQFVPLSFRSLSPHKRVLVCIRFQFRSIDIHMLQIDLFFLNQYLVYPIKKILDILPQVLYEVAEASVARLLSLHQVLISKIHFAVVFQIPQRDPSFVHEPKQYCLQHIHRIVSRTPRPAAHLHPDILC